MGHAVTSILVGGLGQRPRVGVPRLRRRVLVVRVKVAARVAVERVLLVVLRNRRRHRVEPSGASSCLRRRLIRCLAIDRTVVITSFTIGHIVIGVVVVVVVAVVTAAAAAARCCC